MRLAHFLCWAAISGSLLGAAGCGGSGRKKVKTVEVSGAVYLDDKPLEGVTVFFLNKDHTGIGKTGPDGKYKLGEGGAQPGENKIYFRKPAGTSAGTVGPATIDPAVAQPPTAEATGAIPPQAIPAKYADPAKSSMTFTVPEKGTSSADFKLTSR